MDPACTIYTFFPSTLKEIPHVDFTPGLKAYIRNKEHALDGRLTELGVTFVAECHQDGLIIRLNNTTNSAMASNMLDDETCTLHAFISACEDFGDRVCSVKVPKSVA